MIKFIVFSVLIFSTLVSFAQSNSSLKEYRITAGIGIANGTKNSVSIGRSLWLQHAYRFASKFSIATEYENLIYKQPNSDLGIAKEFDKIKLNDHNISLLFKYQLLKTNRLRIEVVSGGTYCIQQKVYYYRQYFAGSLLVFGEITTVSDYKVPLLTEFEYSLSKTINIQVRVKYNESGNERNTYSAGIGMSVKL